MASESLIETAGTIARAEADNKRIVLPKSRESVAFFGLASFRQFNNELGTVLLLAESDGKTGEEEGFRILKQSSSLLTTVGKEMQINQDLMRYIDPAVKLGSVALQRQPLMIGFDRSATITIGSGEVNARDFVELTSDYFKRLLYQKEIDEGRIYSHNTPASSMDNAIHGIKTGSRFKDRIITINNGSK